MITFRADTAGAITQIDALARRVLTVDQQLNTALGRLTGARGANAGPLSGIATGARQASTELDRALARLVRLREEMRISSQTPGMQTPVTSSRLRQAIIDIQRLADAQRISATQAQRWSQQVRDAFNNAISGRSIQRLVEQRRQLEQALQDIRIRSGGFNVGAGGDAERRTLRSLIDVNRELSRLGEGLAPGRLRTFTQQFAQLPPVVSRATQSIRELVAQRARLEAKLGDIRIASGGFNIGAGGMAERQTLRSLIEINRELSRQGEALAPGRVRTYLDQFRQLPPVLSRATQAMMQNVAAIRQQVEQSRLTSQTNLLTGRSALGAQAISPLESFRVPPRQLMQGYAQSIALVRAGHTEAGESARFFATEINRLPPAFDSLTTRFGHHAQRIAEGILIYDALGRTIQGVSATISDISTVLREQIRFEQVVGPLNDEEASGFISNLGDIAIRTNTQMGDLASVLDTVAASMIDVGSAAQKQADSQQILNDIGQFTNITQRSVAEEADNLIGLFNISGDSIDQFSDRLGRITVAGSNSSATISGIVDALSEAGRAASEFGFDLDVLTALAGRVLPRFRGAISGRELGSAINTFLGKLSDPTVVAEIEKISQGLIRVRDETGALLPASDVFIQMALAMRDASTEAERLAIQKVVDQVVPPLSPGQRATLNTLLRELPAALEASGPQMAATAKNASDLSEALTAGPAETVSKALIALGLAAQQAFSDDVVAGARALAGAISGLAGIVSFLGSGIGGTVLQVLTFVAASKALLFVLRNLATLFFGRQIRAAAMAAEMAGLGIAARGATGQLTLFGRSAGTVSSGIPILARNLVGLRGAMITLAASFGPLLAAMAAMMALDFFGQVSSQAQQLEDQIGSLAGEAGAGGLDALIARLESQLDTGDDTPWTISAKEIFVDPEIRQNIETLKALRANIDLVGDSVSDLDARLAELRQRREDTGFAVGFDAVNEQKALDAQIALLQSVRDKLPEDTTGIELTFDVLSGGFYKAGQGAEDAGEEIFDFTAYMEQLDRQMQAGTDSMNEFTTAEQRAAQATIINNGLSDVRGRILRDLLDQLDRGKLSLDEFSSAEANVGRATEITSRFLAAYGDQLNIIPGLQERMARTGENAGEAMTRILLSNPNTFNQIVDQVEALIELYEQEQEAREVASEHADSNPINPRIETGRISQDAANLSGLYEGVEREHSQSAMFFETVRPTPQLNLDLLRQQLREALRMLELVQNAALVTYRTVSGVEFSRPLGRGLTEGVDDTFATPGLTGDGGALEQRIRDLRDQIRDALRRLERAGDDNTRDQISEEINSRRAIIDELLGIQENDKRLSDREAAASRPQTALQDVGDLSNRQVQRAVAIARRLQNAIPGAAAAARDETIALTRDARFLQFIRGLDQRYLAEAIEALTEVERRRLELEQQRLQDVTRSMVTRVGPIQSLVSAPVLSAGGGLLTGAGLNADPRLGNVTINVPINWSGMSLRELQQFIYKAISQAWVDAGRGG